MKKLVLLLTLTLSALPAFADLGDTYAQSCHRYGGRGEVHQDTHNIIWQTKYCYITERFVRNRCVFLLLTPFQGRHYEDSDVGQILAQVSSQQWTHYRFSDGRDDLGEWATEDHSILVGLFVAPSGTTTQIQVAYRSYLASKGLLTRNDDSGDSRGGDFGSAPVEDDGARM